MTWRGPGRILLVLAGLVTARGAAAQSTTAQHAGHFPIDSTWLSYDSASKTVKFKLIAGLTGGAKSPFNFNGFTDGELTLTVPLGSTVVMSFVNDDGTPHSAVLIPGDEPIPNMAGEPAIPRAYTRDATQGLAQGQTDIIALHGGTRRGVPDPLRSAGARAVGNVDPFRRESRRFEPSSEGFGGELRAWTRVPGCGLAQQDGDIRLRCYGNSWPRVAVLAGLCIFSPIREIRDPNWFSISGQDWAKLSPDARNTFLSGFLAGSA